MKATYAKTDISPCAIRKYFFNLPLIRRLKAPVIMERDSRIAVIVASK